MARRVKYTDADITHEPFPITHRFKSIIGNEFGRLKVVAYSGHRRGNYYWWCKCVCGGVTKTTTAKLNSRHSSSCGCLHSDVTAERSTVHGHTHTPEYKAFAAAKTRCQSPNSKGWMNYGGRGIEFRFECFEQFLTHVGQRPSIRHSIDRIDVNGHYEVGNVRWATDKEQSNNRRNNRVLVFGGVSRTLSEWSDSSNISIGLLSARLRHGWCAECTLTLPRGDKCKHRLRTPCGVRESEAK